MIICHPIPGPASEPSLAAPWEMLRGLRGLSPVQDPAGKPGCDFFGVNHYARGIVGFFLNPTNKGPKGIADMGCESSHHHPCSPTMLTAASGPLRPDSFVRVSSMPLLSMACSNRTLHHRLHS